MKDNAGLGNVLWRDADLLQQCGDFRAPLRGDKVMKGLFRFLQLGVQGAQVIQVLFHIRCAVFAAKTGTRLQEHLEDLRLVAKRGVVYRGKAVIVAQVHARPFVDQQRRNFWFVAVASIYQQGKSAVCLAVDRFRIVVGKSCTMP
jgi:hypothetical protein